jgi:hypothetical protein
VKLVVALLVLVWTSIASAAPSLKFAARSGRVTVFAERGLEDTARELAESAEETLGRIRGDLEGLPVPDQIEVRLVTQASDLAAIAPGGRGAPPWAIGVAYPDLGVSSVALRRGPQLADPAATLRHELAHIALGAALGSCGERGCRGAPRWLHEGFAYQHSREWSVERMETLAGMAWMGSTIPLDQLDNSFPAQEVIAHRAYAESYDFVGFLSRRGRYDDTSDDGDRWPFRRFLTLVGQTGDLDGAAKAAFGRPLHALFDEWRDDLTKRYMLVPIGLFGLAAWILCALLLVVAWWRRKRQNRRRVAQWEAEDRLRREQAPPVPLVIDVLDADDDELPDPDPTLLN